MINLFFHHNSEIYKHNQMLKVTIFFQITTNFPTLPLTEIGNDHYMFKGTYIPFIK